jgi:hypothetical protein
VRFYIEDYEMGERFRPGWELEEAEAKVVAGLIGDGYLRLLRERGSTCELLMRNQSLKKLSNKNGV